MTNKTYPYIGEECVTGDVLQFFDVGSCLVLDGGNNKVSEGEWPQVGDEAATRIGKATIIGIKDCNGMYAIIENGEYSICDSTYISPIKSPDELMRSELESLFNNYVDSDKPTEWFIDKTIELFNTIAPRVIGEKIQTNVKG